MTLNLEQIRADFPITEDYIYLDNAALFPYPTPVVERVAAKLRERSQFGVHKYSGWLEIVEKARAQVAQLIGAEPDEVAFTQNTSEGINIVANVLDWRPGDNVIINNLEYFANVYPWARLRRQRGVEVRIVPHKDGWLDLKDIQNMADKRTRVIALSHVEWINGLRHDLEAIGRFAHSLGAYLVVDAIQSVGAVKVDVRAGHVDFLACGGHKWLMTPLGTGIFYCRRELVERFEPVYVGCYSDEQPSNYTFRDDYRLARSSRRFNYGNSNVAGIHGLHAALDYLEGLGLEQVFARNRQLADLLVRGLSRAGVRFLSPLDDRYRSHIVTFIPRDVDATLRALEEERISVSPRGGGIRVSPAFYNSGDEIEALIAVVSEVEAG